MVDVNRLRWWNRERYIYAAERRKRYWEDLIQSLRRAVLKMVFARVEAKLRDVRYERPGSVEWKMLKGEYEEATQLRAELSVLFQSRRDKPSTPNDVPLRRVLNR